MGRFCFLFLIFLGSIVARANDIPVEVLQQKHNHYQLYFKVPSFHTVYGPQAKEMGFPFSLNWHRKENIKNIRAVFPTEEKIAYGDKSTFGYTKPFFIDLYVDVEDLGDDFVLEGTANYLACYEQCEPKTTEIRLPHEIHNNTSQTLGVILLLALVAGFLLNFMPCILPVLAIKAFGILKSSRQELTVFKKSHRLMAFGCFFFFIAFSAFVELLRYSGLSVGWGMHFQNPYFICFYIWVLLALFMKSMTLRDVHILEKLEKKVKHPVGLGLLQGFLLALLATPCTGPFLGLVMGYTLTHPLWENIAVYSAIGFGFTSPYILIGLYPQVLQKVLPKPGNWMHKVELLFSGLIGAAILWCLFILSREIGWMLTLFFGAILLVCFFGIKKFPAKTKLFLFVGFLAIFIPAFEEEDTSATPFKLSELKDKVLEEGRPLLVNVTATWCLTCHANTLTLKNDRVKEILEAYNADLVTIDWTKKDASIRNLIHHFKRDGIPFTFLLTPKHLKGVPLPEILTPNLIEQYLAKYSQSREEGGDFSV